MAQYGMNRLRTTDLMAPCGKPHFIQRINLRLRSSAWKKINRFRDSTPAVKLYVIGWIVFAAFPLLLGLAPTPHKDLALIPFLLALTLAAVGLGLELCRPLRRLCGTRLSQILFGTIFSGLVLFVADLIGRQILYDMTRENPETFLAARAALTIIFAPFVGVSLALLIVFVAIVICAVVAMLSTICLPFLSQRLSSLIGRAMFRSLGLLGFFVLLFIMEYQLISLKDHWPQLALVPKAVAVRSSFSRVPDGQYTVLKPNSFVSFLSGDRVCVAELMPDGEFNFHTIRRDDLK
jgi:MFS family permease